MSYLVLRVDYMHYFYRISMGVWVPAFSEIDSRETWPLTNFWILLWTLLEFCHKALKNVSLSRLFFGYILWLWGVSLEYCPNILSSARTRRMEAPCSPACQLDGYLYRSNQTKLAVLSLERQQRPAVRTTSPTLSAPGCRCLPCCRTLGNGTLPVPYKQVFPYRYRWCLFLL